MGEPRADTQNKRAEIFVQEADPGVCNLGTFWFNPVTATLQVRGQGGWVTLIGGAGGNFVTSVFVDELDGKLKQTKLATGTEIIIDAEGFIYDYLVEKGVLLEP